MKLIKNNFYRKAKIILNDDRTEIKNVFQYNKRCKHAIEEKTIIQMLKKKLLEEYDLYAEFKIRTAWGGYGIGGIGQRLFAKINIFRKSKHLFIKVKDNNFEIDFECNTFLRENVASISFETQINALINTTTHNIKNLEIKEDVRMLKDVTDKEKEAIRKFINDFRNDFKIIAKDLQKVSNNFLKIVDRQVISIKRVCILYNYEESEPYLVLFYPS